MEGFFEISLRGAERVSHRRKEGRALTALEKRRCAFQTHPDTLVNKVLLREPMAFGTQDLLVLFLSSGMALFALNIYKISTAGAKA